MVPGTRLASRYVIERRLGRGGMGEVWAATDTVLGRQVAVKTVDVSALDSDPTAQERFRREATVTASLSHENIVSVFDFGADGPIAFLVMELLPGPSLAAVAADRGPLPVPDALRFAGQVADALAVAHQLGLVHRDVKPSNLMFDARGRVKVLDFGIARLVESTAAQLTATATVVGSAPYMAPEQALGQPVGPATDLYALGCVLMVLLTGEPPFTGEHPLAVTHQQVSSQPPSVSDRRPDVPASVDGLVAQLLAKDPARRGVGAEAISVRIADILRDPQAGPVDVTRPLPDPTGWSTRAQLLPSPPPRGSLRRWWPYAVAGLAVALIIGFLVLASGDNQATPPAAQGAQSPAKGPTPSPQPSHRSQPTRTPTSTPTPTHVPRPLTRSQALHRLRDTIQSSLRSGQLDEASAKDLDHRVEDLVKHLDEGKADDFSHKLDDFSHRLDDLAKGGKVSATGEARIRRALHRV